MADRKSRAVMQYTKIVQNLRYAARNLSSSNQLRPAHNASLRGRDEAQFPVGDTYNDDWVNTARGSRLSFVRSPVIRQTDKVFTMGSCFAREVRHALHDRGFHLFPEYNRIKFDPVTQKFKKLSAREHVNHYNTFSIRQEFEDAFSGKSYVLNDLIERRLHEQKAMRETNGSRAQGKNWQDPYRRNVYAATPEAIVDLSRKIGSCIRDGVFESDVYVLTLGLTEVWRNDRNGLYVNQVPDNERDGICPGFTFEQSTYEQNFENMHKVCSLLSERFPQRKIIVTVSPVALKRTFSGNDIVVANMESKSILRAVAAAITRQFANVIYWPSYEIALARDVYEEDGRHVTAQDVQRIINQFLAVHLEDHA